MAGNFNFPVNPPNGTQYTGPNNVVYTYESSKDAWIANTSSGPPGPVGPPGPPGGGGAGTSGFSGISGYSGPPGPGGGTSGFSGTSGYSGGSGFSGFSGPVGPPGPPGAGSGTAGTSGFSGTSGYSGATTYTYNVKNYGAKGNGSTVPADMTAETNAIQAAINAAQTSGGTVFFPAGTYTINGILSITTNSSDPAARPQILGEGIGGSVIYQTAAVNGISVTGNSSVPGTYVSIQSLSIVGSGSGAGITFSDSAFARVCDVHITGWTTGIYAIDSLSMLLEKVVIRFNTNGFRFERSTSGAFLTNPNAITMVGCIVGNNSAYGGWVIGAGAFNYLGGSIESNAANTSESSSNWGLRISDPGGDTSPEAAVGFALHGVYFEANGGIANLLIDATESNTGLASSITGCSFVRVSTAYTTNNIRCEASSSTYGFPIAVVGCGFRGLGGYSANAGRKNIFNSSNYFPINLVSCAQDSSIDEYTAPVPTTTNSPGTPGMVTTDSTYLYICGANGKWYRYSLTTF